MSTTSERCVIPAVWADLGHRAIEAVPSGLDRVGWNRGRVPRRFQEPFDIGAVSTSVAFVMAGPVSLISVPRLSSYRLKHIAEQWGARVGLASYVMNGDLIAALLFCNVPVGCPNGANCGVGLVYEEGA